jgi:hypothetical protein
MLTKDHALSGKTNEKIKSSNEESNEPDNDEYKDH